MNRIALLLITGAWVGFIGETTQAGALVLSTDLNGVIIFTATSTTPDQSVNANLTLVNAALTAHGSAYQFTSLSAQSNYPGTGVGMLTTNASLNTEGSGNTSQILSIDVTQSGFTAPTGASGQIISSSSVVYTNASGSLSFTSDYQGANTPTITFSAMGSRPDSNSTGEVPVGSIPPGYELSNHFLVSLNQGASASLFGTADLSVPEPGSIALLGLAAVGLLTRRRAV